MPKDAVKEKSLPSLRKLKGCGKLLVAKDFSEVYWEVPRKKYGKYQLYSPQYHISCGTYRKSSWYRRTSITLCQNCITEMGLEW